jgi:hypothetical protein
MDVLLKIGGALVLGLVLVEAITAVIGRLTAALAASI